MGSESIPHETEGQMGSESIAHETEGQMGSESIAHKTDGQMGYRLRGHEGKRNNYCISKIQLVGQKISGQGILR